jgi:hypothetical protein
MALTVIGFGLYLDLIPSHFDLAVFALAILVAGLAIYRLIRGALLASYDRLVNETWSDRFRRSGSAEIALLILTTIAGAVLFVALNAGLKLIGL